MSLNQQTGETVAEGHVRIEHDNMAWAGEHIRYNFKTRQLDADAFRAGQPPVFAAGNWLHGDVTNQTYTAINARITTDDVSEPAHWVRAKSLTIVPGKYLRARHALVYVGGVPVFYFPYYTQRLDSHASHFLFNPGYKSSYGPFVLSGYQWYLNDYIDGVVHADYRERRGAGGGPDVNLHLLRWGEFRLKYYYLRDNDPQAGNVSPPVPEDRHQYQFSYAATPFTNLDVKGLASYQSDERVLRDFFEGEYARNPQQKTFIDVNQRWDNYSVDVYAQTRINDFLDTTERLPEVRLTAFRQQIGPLPLDYESETTAGWYQRLFSDTNNPAIPGYSASRADTFHQLTAPITLFGWLNIAPRVGGRFTYYGRPTATNTTGDDLYRGVFNTGAEASFKLSRLWAGAQNNLFDVDGLRHVIVPSVNYVYVPRPHHRPAELPQFDPEFPSVEMMPIEFPDYNSVDSIDSQNVLRLGLQNKLQTMRRGQLENVVNWELYSDWRLRPDPGQTMFSDVFSDLSLRPGTRLGAESKTRWDPRNGVLNLAFHQLSIEPNDRWSLGLGHWYLRDGFLDAGRSLASSIVFYRLSENWGLRAQHFVNTRNAKLEEQDYGIYRDLRSWTAALALRLRDSTSTPNDFAIAFTFSFKAAPRYGLGSDTVRPYQLLGQ